MKSEGEAVSTDNQPVLAGLVMDRSKPIGNSEGADDRGRIHTKISNKDTEPIPINIIDTEVGDPWFQDFNGLLSGDTAQTVITYTVPANIKINLVTLDISCRVEALATVSINGTIVSNLRTGAAQPSDSFTWNPRRPAISGDVITVIMMKRAGTSDVSVGAHLMGLTINV